MSNVEVESCEHQWISNSGAGGKPDFRPNRQMSKLPIMHVRCFVCGCRTWFTEWQWDNQPYTSEEKA